MDTNAPQPESTDRGGIRKNVTLLALVIFFIATISASGGLLQEERFSQGETANSAQAGSALGGENTALAQLSQKDPARAGSASLLQTCLSGEEESCRNKCSTTYVSVAVDSGGQSSAETTDCYGRGGDPTKNLIRELATCINENAGLDAGGNVSPPWFADENRLRQAVCIDQRKVELDQTAAGEKTQSQANIQESDPLVLPAACASIQEELITIQKGRDAQRTATSDNAATCAWKGAVVCYDADGPGPGTQWECGKKSDAGTSSPQPPPKQQSALDCIRKAIVSGNLLATLRCRGGQQTSGFTTPSRSDPSAQRPQQQSPEKCPTGYTQSTERERTVCIKDEADSAQPQCVLAASKEKINAGEKVAIRWRTANAETVSITGIGGAVAKNGEKTVTPDETTTYTLTATGKGKKIKTCGTTITVEGAAGETPAGVSSPKLSCQPNTIQKGTKGNIQWQCTAAANSSNGEGFDTNGKVAGKATVEPAYNTEYTVVCLDKNDKDLGRGSCPITVGESKYDIIVYPTTAKRGDRVRVSWASLFMKSCRVQGPRGFDYNRAQGVVLTEPFTLDQDSVPNRNIRAAVYTIECESQFGGRVSRDVAVRFQE